MSTFEVRAYHIKIEEHPNADALELAKIGEYRSVVGKGQYEDGDLVLYIPEASILTPELIKEMGLEGRLAGSEQNRVKAIKLRGSISQGLIYPITDAILAHIDPERKLEAFLAYDWANYLGISKWDPPIPVHMAGQVYHAGSICPKFDIENFKAHPDVLKEGEEVLMTEKLHGTFCVVGILPPAMRHEKHIQGKFVIGSKGLSEKGLFFKDVPENDGNLYVKTIKELGILEALERVFEKDITMSGEPVWLRGEIFGAGVQDLKYGQTKPVFRMFNMEVGTPFFAWWTGMVWSLWPY